MVVEAKQLAHLVDFSDHQQVFEEVQTIVRLILPSFDFQHVTPVFEDMKILFRGEYPGYRACNTEYHDISHTHEVLLGMLRLMHGAFIAGAARFSEKEINIALISALMHDTGYLQESGDQTGTGAKYTLIHIQRSTDFIRNYYAGHDYFKDSQPAFRDILCCTGLMTKVKEIQFSSAAIALLGKMLGTADLLGQMADRCYLEKLLFLYTEFQEAGIQGYTSELDLLEKTVGFYDTTRKRFADELGGVNGYAIHHFRERWHIDRDLYGDAISGNIEYLKKLLSEQRDDYFSFLRRGDLARKFRSAMAS